MDSTRFRLIISLAHNHEQKIACSALVMDCIESVILGPESPSDHEGQVPAMEFDVQLQQLGTS